MDVQWLCVMGVSKPHIRCNMPMLWLLHNEHYLYPGCRSGLFLDKSQIPKYKRGISIDRPRSWKWCIQHIHRIQVHRIPIDSQPSSNSIHSRNHHRNWRSGRLLWMQMGRRWRKRGERKSHLALSWFDGLMMDDMTKMRRMMIPTKIGPIVWTNNSS